MIERPENLTRSEHQALAGLLRFYSNKEIATAMGISERTAKFHVSNILRKFGARRRSELFRKLMWTNGDCGLHQ